MATEDEMSKREGPFATIAAFFAGVVTLVWGAWEMNWLLVAAGIFVLLVSAQYYLRYARHIQWRQTLRESGRSTNDR